VPTYTTRLGLTKQAGSENVNIGLINDVLDILDASVGVTVCTSGSRPASPFQGRAIYETDTGKILVNSGASASPSWQDPVTNGLAGTITIGGDANISGTVRPTVATTATLAFGSAITGDGFRRFAVTGGGVVEWGAGSGSRDTNLYRSTANRLKTDDTFEAVGGLVAGNDSSVTGNLTVTGTTSASGGLDLPSTIWTPSWSSVTQGTGAVNAGYYLDLGDWMLFSFRLQFGTSPSFSSTIQMTLPAAAWVGGGTNIQATCGSWTFRDTSGTYHYSGSMGIWSSAGTSVSFNGAWDGTQDRGRITNAVPVTVQVDDVLSGCGIYKKA
jgi:hypothetical protein